jgi:ribosomal protein S18 acetylase RimI-like enzyme
MIYRKATEKDLPQIVKILAEDELGKFRELYTEPLLNEYITAFKAINSDKNQELMVITAKDQSTVIATFQLTFIPYLSYKGRSRALLENVMVQENYRGQKIGENIINWCIERAKFKNAHMLQLNSDKQRPRAIKFYERLGFKASHEGMKLHF